MKPSRIAAAAAVALVLAACGGGTEERAGALDFVARVTPDAARSDRMRAMSAATRTTPTTVITNAELFAYAETAFPALFPRPSQSLTVPYQGKTFDVRAYAATGNYIGIANGEVYGLGPFTNNQLRSFGTLESLTCTVNPARCQPGGGGGGTLNECIDPRTSSLPTGFRTHLIYVFTSGGPVANFEVTTDSVVDGPAAFEGQNAVQTTITSTSTFSTSLGGQGSSTTTTNSTIRAYAQPSNNGLIKSIGNLADNVSTTQISIPGSPIPLPPTTTTTRSKTVETPPSENVEFTLAVGQSLDKTTTQVTTPLEPAGSPVTTTMTMRYTYQARETISVQGRSFDTCRYAMTLTTAGTTATTLSWFIVGKGVPARIQSSAAGQTSNMELKQGSTYDGQPL